MPLTCSPPRFGCGRLGGSGLRTSVTPTATGGSRTSRSASSPGRGFMLLFEAWVWLYRLCSWMMHSRLEPMKELARLFRRHFATIIYLTCGSSHINGSSDCDAQEQLRARLDCLLEPTGAGIDDLVDTPAGIWWGFRWHTGFQANPASGTAPDFGVGPVRMSIDCRLNRDRIRCPGSRFLSFFTNGEKPISAGHMLRNTKSAE